MADGRFFDTNILIHSRCATQAWMELETDWSVTCGHRGVTRRSASADRRSACPSGHGTRF